MGVLSTAVKIAAATALATLLITAQAHAAPGDKTGMAVALKKWGEPACGTPHFYVSTPAAYAARFGTDNFGDSMPLAWADETRCAIMINGNLAPVEIRTPVKRCHVIVHEWGHLAGYRDPSNTADPEHSDNPRSVMYGEDLVVESRERIGKRWKWVAGGAFKPCYEMAAPGVQVG